MPLFFIALCQRATICYKKSLYLRQIQSLRRGNTASDSLFLFIIKKVELETTKEMLEKKIEKLLLEKFKEEEFADCFIVEIILHEHNKLDVFVDCDSALDFRKCQRLSRYLEGFIDEEGWLGEKYTLEVSSPGLTRPLKFPRQYTKNIGRDFKVKQIEGKEEEGTLIAVSDEGIVLEKKVRIKEGKKKRTEIVQTPIAFDNIKKAKVKISFSKK